MKEDTIKQNNGGQEALDEVLQSALSNTNPDKSPRVLFNAPSLQRVRVTDGCFGMTTEIDDYESVDYRLELRRDLPPGSILWAFVQSGAGGACTVFAKGLSGLDQPAVFVGYGVRLGLTASKKGGRDE